MLVWLVCFININVILAIEQTAQLRLVDYLLTGYKSSVIPLKNPQNESIDVSVSFTLLRVHNLDEKTQTLSSLGYITLKWKDELLQWNPDNYGGITELVLLPDDIWLPDFQVINSIIQPEDIALSETMRFRPTVSSTGDVTWSPGQHWETYCPINLIFFPFDTQLCNITLVNFVNTATGNVKLRLDNQKVDQPTLSGPVTEEWILKSAYANIHQLNFAYSNQTNSPTKSHSVATLTMELARASSFYIFNIVIPVVIITQISALVYIIPCESGEKVSFSITLLVAYFVMLLIVSDLMPRSGNTLPYITTYIVICMFLNGMSLFCTIIVLKVYHHNPYTRVPACIRALAFGCCGCLKSSTKGDYLKMTMDREYKQTLRNEFSGRDVDKFSKRQLRDELNQKLEQQLREHELTRNKEEWQQLAIIMDKIFFICSVLFITGLTVIYFVMVSVAAWNYNQLLDELMKFSSA